MKKSFPRKHFICERKRELELWWSSRRRNKCKIVSGGFCSYEYPIVIYIFCRINIDLKNILFDNLLWLVLCAMRYSTCTPIDTTQYSTDNEYMRQAAMTTMNEWMKRCDARRSEASEQTKQLICVDNLIEIILYSFAWQVYQFTSIENIKFIEAEHTHERERCKRMG